MTPTGENQFTRTAIVDPSAQLRGCKSWGEIVELEGERFWKTRFCCPKQKLLPKVTLRVVLSAPKKKFSGCHRNTDI